jgi:DNA replication and repair protein RecF
MSSDFETQALEAFKRSLESDLKHKATTIGVHREDISVSLKNKDIGTYGSQGENRLVALALKLSPYFLIKEEERKPIVVLDDVMSELDKSHREQLIKFLRKFDQVFITDTKLEIEGVTPIKLNKAKEVF